MPAAPEPGSPRVNSPAAPVVAIARYTFLEAVRNRLFLLTAAGLLGLLGITEFIGELAITETAQVQALLVGAAMRMFAVCTVALFVITSVVREANDKGFELLLSLPLPRYAYFCGKYAGFLLLALVIAAASAALLLLYSTPSAVLLWFISLFCELGIVIALALLCLFSFSNVTVSFILVLACYLLARAMDSIQLISASPLLEPTGIGQLFLKQLVDAIAFVLPDLQRFSRGEWLAWGADWAGLGFILAQTAIYCGLLAAAALFDLYRKEL